MAPNYGPKITTDGLVLALDAANPKSYPGTGTTWYDISGNGNHGQIIGANTYTQNNLGKFDYRGVSQITDYIKMPHNALQQTTGSYTIIFWMQPQSNGTRYFHSVHSSGNNNYQIMKILSSTISSHNGGGSISFVDDEIIQMTLVRNGTNTGIMYKNGVSESVTSTLVDLSAVLDNGWILNQEQDSVEGGFSSTQNAYAAFMNIFMYDRALSETEVKQNYNALKGRFGI